MTTRERSVTVALAFVWFTPAALFIAATLAMIFCGCGSGMDPLDPVTPCGMRVSGFLADLRGLEDAEGAALGAYQLATGRDGCAAVDGRDLVILDETWREEYGAAIRDDSTGIAVGPLAWCTGQNYGQVLYLLVQRAYPGDAWMCEQDEVRRLDRIYPDPQIAWELCPFAPLGLWDALDSAAPVECQP